MKTILQTVLLVAILAGVGYLIYQSADQERARRIAAGEPAQSPGVVINLGQPGTVYAAEAAPNRAAGAGAAVQTQPAAVENTGSTNANVVVNGAGGGDSAAQAAANGRYIYDGTVPPEPINTNDGSEVIDPRVAARSWDETWEMFGPDSVEGSLMDLEYFKAHPEEFGDGTGTCGTKTRIMDWVTLWPATQYDPVAWTDEFGCYHEGEPPVDYHLPVVPAK